jgi:16S rRNA processing protein RimM
VNRFVAADPLRTIALGRIIGAWGVGGWVKVEPFAGAGETALIKAPSWHLVRSGGPAVTVLDRWVEVLRARRHSSGVVAKFPDCDDRDAALALRGSEVGVRRCDFPALPQGEYYWVDLIGCDISNPAGEALGRVSAIDDHGAHPIIETDAGLLIPYVDAYLIEVAPDEGRIVVDWQADWSR